MGIIVRVEWVKQMAYSNGGEGGGRVGTEWWWPFWRRSG